MKTFLLIVALAFLGGCVPFREFSDGFSREAALQLGDVVSEAVDKEFKERPAPSPVDGTLWNGLGALAAYFAGSFAKGKYREHAAKKNG